MCLFYIDKETKHYTKGYKIFIEYGSYLKGEMFSNGYYQKGVWIEDVHEEWLRSDGYNSTQYKTGFHFFIDLQDAKEWLDGWRIDTAIYEVEVDKCVASGTQQIYIDYFDALKNAKVGVARKMKIGDRIGDRI